jgi:NTP pyrophosphatase (non-canonical NTP hydrolase)
MIITTFDEYQYEARRTQNQNLSTWAMREHALFGLTSEVGEVMGLHQKIHQGHVLDETELRLEIGDVLWFVAELCDVYGWHMSDIAGANIEKLRNRYHDKFSVEESVNRVEYRKKKVKQRSKYYAKGAGA